jgi:hypothetical protein
MFDVGCSMFIFIVCGAACGMASDLKMDHGTHGTHGRTELRVLLVLVLLLVLDPFSWFVERQLWGA